MTGKMNLSIKDVAKENLKDLDLICIPFLDKVEDKSDFIEGIEKRNEWYLKMMEHYGPISKVAYVDDLPAGMIQFIPRVSELVFEIQCIFILEKFAKKGIGSFLLRETINELSTPKLFFKNRPPKALISWAFNVSGLVPQEDLFKKFGFIESKCGRPLYLPIEKDYEYSYSRGKKIQERSNEKKAITVLDTSCPFCIFTVNKYKKISKEVSPEVEVCVVDKFRVSNETKCMIDFCEFNKKKIVSAFAKEDEIKESIKEAMLAKL